MEFLSPSEGSIFGHLAMRQTDFEEHPFFLAVQQNPPHSFLREFIPGMAFWVTAFQDLLEIVEGRVADPALRQIASHIRAGDVGHDHWFVRDLERLGVAVPGWSELFGPGHARTRSASHAIVSEAFRASSDAMLIVLVLALESASYVFFTVMTRYLEDTEFPVHLDYFGRTHLDAEMEHGIVEAGMDRAVEDRVGDDPVARAEAVALIDRVFASFHAMFDGLLALPER